MTLVAYFDIELHQIDVNTLPPWRPRERGLYEKNQKVYHKWKIIWLTCNEC